MIALDSVLSRLDGARRSGRGWIARCPAHPDRRPSLSVAAGANGRALVHCHAGCRYSEVFAALGLEAADPARPGRADRPAEVHRLALALARRQAWADPLAREVSFISRYIREWYRTADILRRAATAAGETETTWAALARAARAEVEAWRVGHALDEALA